SLIIGLAIIGSFTVSAFDNRVSGSSLKQLPRISNRAHSIDSDTLASYRKIARNPNMAQFLKPWIFNRLSSAGQQRVLALSGIDPQPNDRFDNSISKKNISPEIDAGDNIRVNNPDLDAISHTQSETSTAVFGSNVVIGFNDSGGIAFTSSGEIDNLSGYAV